MKIYLFKETKESKAAQLKPKGFFSKKQIKPEVELIGSILLYPGQQLYIFDVSEKKLTAAILNTNRLLMKDGCLYTGAINQSTAKEKFQRMLTNAYKKFSSQSHII